MATATTYTSLVADLQNYPGRGSSSDTRYNNQIPAIIQMAQERLATECATLISRVPIQDAMQAGVAVLTKPNFWNGTISMIIATGPTFNKLVPLLPRSKEFINTYWEIPEDTAEPKFYGDYDQDRWIIGPTPNAAFPVEYVIDLQAEPLDEDTQTNVWTEKAPNLLVAACLFEAEIFLNGNDSPKTQAKERTYDRLLQGYGGKRVADVTDRTEKADK
jgi:hypothetical protein